MISSIDKGLDQGGSYYHLCWTYSTTFWNFVACSAVLALLPISNVWYWLQTLHLYSLEQVLDLLCIKQLKEIFSFLIYSLHCSGVHAVNLYIYVHLWFSFLNPLIFEQCSLSLIWSSKLCWYLQCWSKPRLYDV